MRGAGVLLDPDDVDARDCHQPGVHHALDNGDQPCQVLSGVDNGNVDRRNICVWASPSLQRAPGSGAFIAALPMSINCPLGSLRLPSLYRCPKFRIARLYPLCAHRAAPLAVMFLSIIITHREAGY